jgi:hypothetical protein
MRSEIFLPGDLLMQRSVQVDKICFIVEGEVKLTNKKGVPLALTEVGSRLLMDDKTPSLSISADTFMLVKVLYKADVERINLMYPLINIMAMWDDAVRASIDRIVKIEPLQTQKSWRNFFSVTPKN